VVPCRCHGMALARALVSGWRTGVARIAASRAGQVGGPREFAGTPTEDGEEKPPAPAPKAEKEKPLIAGKLVDNTNRLFVGNLPGWVAEGDGRFLHDIFSVWGPIKEYWVHNEHYDQECKEDGPDYPLEWENDTYGYVRYLYEADYEDALKCCTDPELYKIVFEDPDPEDPEDETFLGRVIVTPADQAPVVPAAAGHSDVERWPPPPTKEKLYDLDDDFDDDEGPYNE